jgi:hypothetical protein
MIRSSIACLALLAGAGTASAQLAVRELEKQTFEWEFANLSVLAQGDLLLRLSARDQVVYVLAPDGTVKARTELPRDRYGSVVPYRNGFAIQRFATDGSKAVQVVAYESPTDADPKVLYESHTSFQSPRVYAAPDGQDLYILEPQQQQMQITRIDSSGQIAWQKAQRGIEWSSFVATDDGVAFAQYVPFQDPARALRALDREGQLRWEMPLAVWDIRESIYSAAGFIALLTDTQSEPGRRKTRLVNFDARTGQLTGDVAVEPFFFATGTKDGVLIGGWMLGQGYVTTLDRKGKHVWLRRYVPNDEVGDVQRGAMTRDGKLFLVTRGRTDPTLAPTTSVVVTDGTAAALGTARGGCLDPDWKESVDAAEILALRGILVAPPTLTEVRKKPGCTDRETQFIGFVKKLSAAARGRTVVLSAERRQILARVTAAGEPIRLEEYAVFYGGITGGGATLMFAAPYDGAAEFWRLISEKVVPHLDTMQEFERRFTQISGCSYARYDRSRASIDEVLAGLENAARVVDQRIAKIAPEELAEIRPRCGAHFVLRRDGFGSGDNAMFPLAEADRTFLEVVRRARETADR